MEVGFQVILKTNVGQIELKRTISEFGKKLTASDMVALFYYFGHGVEIGGTNYMIPVDADIRSAADVDLYPVKIDSVLVQMCYSRNRTRMIILDACRDNPLLSSTSPVLRHPAARDLGP